MDALEKNKQSIKAEAEDRNKAPTGRMEKGGRNGQQNAKVLGVNRGDRPAGTKLGEEEKSSDHKQEGKRTIYTRKIEKQESGLVERSTGDRNQGYSRSKRREIYNASEKARGRGTCGGEGTKMKGTRGRKTGKRKRCSSSKRIAQGHPTEP